MRTRGMRTPRGLSLLELLVVVSIVGIIVAISMPAFANQRRRSAVRAASAELRAVFHQVRSRAIAGANYSAVKFHQDDGRWVYSLYDDGDGDGVRNDDIRRGIDPLVSGPHELLKTETLIRIGLPEFPLPDPDSRRILRDDASPVRFGASTLCSFSPRGASSSGSIFLTDGHQMAAVVRVYGPTAKIRTLRFRPEANRWESR